MKNAIKKFLEFNGRVIHFLAVDGTYWIAIKPICEALNVDFKQQHKNLKSHQVFGQLSCIHTMVGADNRARKMVCLPELFVYGWIFQIRSESADLAEYQKKCCDILYDHFHGAITGRSRILKDKIDMRQRIADLEEKLSDVEEFIEYQDLQESLRKVPARLKASDKELISGQKEIWDSMEGRES